MRVAEAGRAARRTSVAPWAALGATILTVGALASCDGRERSPREAAGEARGGAEQGAPPPGADARSSSGAGETDPLLRPESEVMNRASPDSFRVRFETSEGAFVVQVVRRWAPRGADRLYNLVRHGFFDGSRFFRVIEGFVAQFGLPADPEIASAWRTARIRDDSVRKSNRRGFVSFASAGENTRTTQLFINLADNTRLDTMGFAPVGRVVEGVAVVDRLYAGYGERPSQARITREGEAYLSEEFPRLDVIEEARLVPGRSSSGSS